MTDTSTSGTKRETRCYCGEKEIRYSHADLWECEACGRFLDGEAMDLLVQKTRAGIGGAE
jgi:ribosomal protein L37AE/L43A